MNINERIRNAIKRRHTTERRVAEQIGMSGRTMERRMAKADWRLDELILICKALNEPIERIVKE